MPSCGSVLQQDAEPRYCWRSDTVLQTYFELDRSMHNASAPNQMDSP